MLGLDDTRLNAVFATGYNSLVTPSPSPTSCKLYSPATCSSNDENVPSFHCTALHCPIMRSRAKGKCAIELPGDPQCSDLLNYTEVTKSVPDAREVS